jgi:hypothetical protein
MSGFGFSAGPGPTIAKRRELAGYAAPKEAISCRGCLYRLGGPERSSCGLHQFPVELGAVCGSWAPVVVQDGGGLLGSGLQQGGA